MKDRIKVIQRKINELKHKRNDYKKTLRKEALNDSERLDIKEDIELLELQIECLEKKTKAIRGTKNITADELEELVKEPYQTTSDLLNETKTIYVLENEDGVFLSTFNAFKVKSIIYAIQYIKLKDAEFQLKCLEGNVFFENHTYKVKKYVYTEQEMN